MRTIKEIYSTLQRLDAAIAKAQGLCVEANLHVKYLVEFTVAVPSVTESSYAIRKARECQRSLQAAILRYERQERLAKRHPDFCSYELNEWLIHGKMTSEQSHRFLNQEY